MKKNNPTGLRFFITVFSLVFVLGLAACKTSTPLPTPTSTVTATPAFSLNPTLPAPAPLPTITLDGAKTTSSGLQYLEEVAGSGAAPAAGDLITMNFIASLADGTELVNTYTDGQPATVVWGKGNLLPGWEEGVGLMKAGGKAKLLLPPELAFGVEGTGSIPANSQIVLEVELLKVEAPPVPTTVSADKLTTSSTGLQYYDIKVGDGKEAADKTTVFTDYTIWVKSETGYDFISASKGDSPISFVVGRGDTVFPGWEEGVTGMKVGGKRLLVVPPELALGEQGGGSIPANSTLVLEITLTDVKEPRTATKVDEKDYTTTASGLQYYDLKVGTGASPVTGQTVSVHYTGWLEDGTQFDSSVDRDQPFSFVIGQGNVIPGWDEGVATMKVGGIRQLKIPANLAYGEQGSGSVIPPNATLIFEVELLDIQP